VLKSVGSSVHSCENRDKKRFFHSGARVLTIRHGNGDCGRRSRASRGGDALNVGDVQAEIGESKGLRDRADSDRGHVGRTV